MRPGGPWNDYICTDPLRAFCQAPTGVRIITIYTFHEWPAALVMTWSRWCITITGLRYMNIKGLGLKGRLGIRGIRFRVRLRFRVFTLGLGFRVRLGPGYIYRLYIHDLPLMPPPSIKSITKCR